MLKKRKKRLLSLRDCIINNLKGYSFEELKRLLEDNTEAIIKEAILDAMELYFPEDYSKWIKKKEV